MPQLSAHFSRKRVIQHEVFVGIKVEESLRGVSFLNIRIIKAGGSFYSKKGTEGKTA
jgi:hypothetical protein